MFLVSFHPEQSHPNISRWSRGKQTLVWVGRSTMAQNRGEGQLCQESAWCRCQNLRGWGDEALAASVWYWGSECRQVRKAVPQMTDWAWHQSPSRVRSVNAGEWPIMLCRRHSAWGACLNHVLRKKQTNSNWGKYYRITGLASQDCQGYESKRKTEEGCLSMFQTEGN